jgi:hypothetical protein
MYAGYCYYVVKSLEMTADKVKVHKMSEQEKDEAMAKHQ